MGDLGDMHLGLAAESGAVALGFAVLGVAAGRVGPRKSARHVGMLGTVGIAVAAVLWHRSVVVAVVAVLVAVGSGVASACRCTTARATLLLAAMSLAGVWAAVPDTEAPLVAAVAAVVAVAIADAVGVRPTWGDRAVAVGLVVLTAVVGAAGRSEVVGGLACLGLLVVPIPRRPRPGAGAATIGVHAAIVVVASRGVTRLSVRPAVCSAVGLLLIAVAFALVARRSALDDAAGDAEAA